MSILKKSVSMKRGWSFLALLAAAGCGGSSSPTGGAPASGADPRPIPPIEAPEAARPAVIFVPGMNVNPDRYETTELHQLFRDAGFELRVSRNPSKGSLESRAAGLATELQRLAPGGERVHLLAHSMGGL